MNLVMQVIIDFASGAATQPENLVSFVLYFPPFQERPNHVDHATIKPVACR